MNSNKALRTDNRGVSEILGYTIIFTIIVLTLGAVATSVGPVLDNTEQQQSIDTMEQEFLLIGDKISNVIDGGDQQTHEMDVPIGQISQTDEYTIDIDGRPEITTEALMYTAETDAKVTYSGGITGVQVDPNDPDSTEMIRRTHTTGNDTVVITIPVFQPGDNTLAERVEGRAPIEILITRGAPNSGGTTTVHDIAEFEMTIEDASPHQRALWKQFVNEFEPLKVEDILADDITIEDSDEEYETVIVRTVPMQVQSRSG